MRTRDRVSGKGLLPRMEARVWKDGKTVSFRYHPIGGKPIALGTDRPAAIQQVLDMNRSAKDAGTVGELWRFYLESPNWGDLADSTKAEYRLCWKELEPRFAAARAALIRPMDINRYLRVERKDAPVRANREMAVLSNLFNLGIERGDLDANPCKQVRRNKEQPRSHAPESADLGAFVGWLLASGGQRKVIAQMAEFAAYGGNRRVEFLRLTWAQIDREAGVVRVQRAKQRGVVVWEKIEIGPKLAHLLDRLEADREKGREYVFCNKFGNPYTSRGFQANWQRFMKEALEDKVIARRFTFHDLRAYYVTLHRTERGQLPELHKNPATTARIYDRRKESQRGGM